MFASLVVQLPLHRVLHEAMDGAFARYAGTLGANLFTEMLGIMSRPCFFFIVSSPRLDTCTVLLYIRGEKSQTL